MKIDFLYRHAIVIIVLITSTFPLTAKENFKKLKQDFVCNSVKVKVPGFPKAYNPSIIRWNGGLLMSFRVNVNPKKKNMAEIGLVWLDDNFVPKSTPQLLNTRVDNPGNTPKSQDARLVSIANHLYIVYNDDEQQSGRYTPKMYVAELLYDGGKFSIKNPECLLRHQGAIDTHWEKNWVPFEYNDTLYLAYTISPHRIFRPLLNGTKRCETIACTWAAIDWWNWGELRGGTPALRVGNEYLSFFHSMKYFRKSQPQKKMNRHYFMGAYTFTASPPFRITRLSPYPIVPNEFYDGPKIKCPWGAHRVIFPGGYILHKKWLWLACGRNDEECWIITMNVNKLLKSLSSTYVSFSDVVE